jgi:hypothetical protein
MLNKVRKSALSSLKSSNKTVKNKATAFKDFALTKDFNITCKANNYKNRPFFNNEQLQSLSR